MTDRFKLLGSYSTPCVSSGTIITCEYRDTDLIVSGYSTGPIPWPVGHLSRGGPNTIIVFGSLVEAIRLESVQALSHWFGVGPGTVTKWRAAFGVGPVTPGTHAVLSTQISKVKQGKPRPRHVIEAMARGRKSKGVSKETRRKMSETHKARDTRPPAAGKPWTPAEDELVRTLPIAEVMSQTGRSYQSVSGRRCELRLPDGRTRGFRKR
ncbi:hypothetical protein [Zavarzinella formosa]|uniref:hypothetical protein n=1 Tax=Zavarzinella formosa TaxID=360055 RepID=UPI0002F53914|nr:hypothetical protein [Zavarzinella formosa]